jgi:hypothetical protein
MKVSGGVLPVSSLLGLFFLLAMVQTAFAQDEPDAPKPALVIYFSNPESESVWTALVDAFPREAAREGSAMPANLQLVAASMLGPHAEFGKLVQVHLSGRCDVPEQAFHPIERGPLGWVPEVAGEIQPFVYVDCERLAQYLGPKLLGMNAGQRRQAMVTAIARIMVHEWLHITLQTAQHTNHGIRRAELTVNDLVQPLPSSAGD